MDVSFSALVKTDEVFEKIKNKRLKREEDKKGKEHAQVIEDKKEFGCFADKIMLEMTNTMEKGALDEYQRTFTHYFGFRKEKNSLLLEKNMNELLKLLESKHQDGDTKLKITVTFDRLSICSTQVYQCADSQEIADIISVHFKYISRLY